MERFTSLSGNKCLEIGKEIIPLDSELSGKLTRLDEAKANIEREISRLEMVGYLSKHPAATGWDIFMLGLEQK